MNLTSLGVLILMFFISTWGFGSLMETIGRIRKRDTRHTFWNSAVIYGIIVIAISIIFLVWPIAGIGAIDLILLGAGLIYPIIIFVIKWVFPDVFAKSSSGSTNSSHQDVVKKRPSVQKQPDYILNNEEQYKPQPSPRSLVDLKNLSPNLGVVSGYIFISYRRSDSADISGRIYDRLVAKFGKYNIFKDVDSIPLGIDFREYLNEKVGACDVLLAIIGDRWLDAKDVSGGRRLEDPQDFVRIEIESALQRNIPVIPLLVRDVKMPKEEDLPSGLRKLVYRNGIPIRIDPDFHRDMDRLIKALEKYVS